MTTEEITKELTNDELVERIKEAKRCKDYYLYMESVFVLELEKRINPITNIH